MDFYDDTSKSEVDPLKVNKDVAVPPSSPASVPVSEDRIRELSILQTVGRDPQLGTPISEQVSVDREGRPTVQQTLRWEQQAKEVGQVYQGWSYGVGGARPKFGPKVPVEDQEIVDQSRKNQEANTQKYIDANREVQNRAKQRRVDTAVKLATDVVAKKEAGFIDRTGTTMDDVVSKVMTDSQINNDPYLGYSDYDRKRFEAAMAAQTPGSKVMVSGLKQYIAAKNAFETRVNSKLTELKGQEWERKKFEQADAALREAEDKHWAAVQNMDLAERGMKAEEQRLRLQQAEMGLTEARRELELKNKLNTALNKEGITGPEVVDLVLKGGGFSEEKWRQVKDLIPEGSQKKIHDMAIANMELFNKTPQELYQDWMSKSAGTEVVSVEKKSASELKKEEEAKTQSAGEIDQIKEDASKFFSSTSNAVKDIIDGVSSDLKNGINKVFTFKTDAEIRDLFSRTNDSDLEALVARKLTDLMGGDKAKLAVLNSELSRKTPGINTPAQDVVDLAVKYLKGVRDEGTFSKADREARRAEAVTSLYKGLPRGNISVVTLKDKSMVAYYTAGEENFGRSFRKQIEDADASGQREELEAIVGKDSAGTLGKKLVTPKAREEFARKRWDVPVGLDVAFKGADELKQAKDIYKNGTPHQAALIQSAVTGKIDEVETQRVGKENAGFYFVGDARGRGYGIIVTGDMVTAYGAKPVVLDPDKWTENVSALLGKIIDKTSDLSIKVEKGQSQGDAKRNAISSALDDVRKMDLGEAGFLERKYRGIQLEKVGELIAQRIKDKFPEMWLSGKPETMKAAFWLAADNIASDEKMNVFDGDRETGSGEISKLYRINKYFEDQLKTFGMSYAELVNAVHNDSLYISEERHEALSAMLDEYENLASDSMEKIWNSQERLSTLGYSLTMENKPSKNSASVSWANSVLRRRDEIRSFKTIHSKPKGLRGAFSPDWIPPEEFYRRNGYMPSDWLEKNKGHYPSWYKGER